MHSVANLATLQSPLATFLPSKKRPNLVSENHRYCRASARSCSPRAHTPLSLLSLSLCVCSVSLPVRAHPLSLSLSASAQFLFSDRQRGAARFNSVKQILCCFSNLTCKYSRNHSTAIVFILCVFDFIRRRCDYHDFLCADEHLGRESWLCLNGSRFSHYFIFIPLSDNRNSQIYQ